MRESGLHQLIRILAGCACAGPFAPALAFVPAQAATPGSSAQPEHDEVRRHELAGQAGHDGRFFIARDDPPARLSISGTSQFRYVANFNPEDPQTGDAELTNGFQFRRLRLSFRGGFERAGIDFSLQSEFARGTGTLLDAFVRKRFDGGAWVLVGQHEVEYSREVTVVSTRQLAIERSLTEEVFGLDRVTGIALGIDRDRWRARATLSDGRRAGNTSFFDAADADVALTLRAEYRLFDAPWKQFSDFSAFLPSERGLLLGVGLHAQSDGRIPDPAAPGDDDTLWQGTVDASYEDSGWTLMLAAHARSIESDAGDAVDTGLVAHAGVFVDERSEVYARLVQLWPDADRSDSDPFSSLAVGTTRYFIPESHAAKLTIDASVLLSDPDSSASLVSTPNTSQGIVPGAESGQVVLSAQLQLLF